MNKKKQFFIVLKPMVLFMKVLKHFTEVLKPMIFYGGFKTHGIL